MDDFVIFYFTPYGPYLLNLGSLYHPHGLEEVPVIQRPGPGYLPEVV